MARERSTNRTAALKLWMKSGRSMPLKEIAVELGVSDVMIRKWKFLDKWDEIPARRPRGAPKGNQNAVGNAGGPGGPHGNDKALKHGLYRKFLPQDEEFQELMEIAQQMEPLDILWQSVEIAYAKMLWAQRIMFVKDKDDMTKEIKKTETMSTEEMSVSKQEWEIQFAWDKQAVDIKTFSVAMRELRSAIKQFLEAAPQNDERRAKLELIQAQVTKTNMKIEDMKKAGKTPGRNNPTQLSPEERRKRIDELNRRRGT